MIYFLKVTLVLILVPTFICQTVPCRLSWLSYSVGNLIPADAVTLDDNADSKIYPIRGTIYNTLLIGTYDPKLDFPLFPLNITFNDDMDGITFDILTNPYACNLTWIGSATSKNEGDDWVSANSSAPLFVSRKLETGKYVGGYTTDGELLFVGKFNEEKNESSLVKYEGTNFQILRGWSDGLELELIQLEFVDDPLGGQPDFIGIDEIHNLADTVVIQRVSHRKKVRQTTTITITETWTTTTTKTVTVNFLFYKKTKKETKTVSNSKSTVVTSIEETDIEVEREIQVGPKTSVQACSTLTLKENSEVTYTALGRYSAKGLSAVELLEIVEKELKEKEPWIEGEYVYIKVVDKISFSLAMSSNFIVVPADAINGCSALQNDISEQKAIRRRLRNNYTIIAFDENSY